VPSLIFAVNAKAVHLALPHSANKPHPQIENLDWQKIGWSKRLFWALVSNKEKSFFLNKIGTNLKYRVFFIKS
jgi:hypothetical protein